MQIAFEQRRQRRIIGLTPLIDVVFILLVFFMLASSFTDWQSVRLGVPGNGQASSGETQTLVIRLFEDGGLAVDGTPVDSDAFVLRMREVFSSDPERAVVVRPDAGVTLQRIVTVVEGLTAAGGSRITLNRQTR